MSSLPISAPQRNPQMIASRSPIEVTVVTGASAVSLAPAIIDTEMQSSLRISDAQRFAKFKADGALDSPGNAASKVLAWLHREDFGREPVADVRDAS